MTGGNMTKLNPSFINYPKPYIAPTAEELSGGGDCPALNRKSILSEAGLLPREKTDGHRLRSEIKNKLHNSLPLVIKYRQDDKRSASKLLDRQAKKASPVFCEARRTDSELILFGNRFISKTGEEILYPFHGKNALEQFMILEADRAIGFNCGLFLQQIIEDAPSGDILPMVKIIVEDRRLEEINKITAQTPPPNQI
jgi:hypothetical protein